ncbi:MAG: glycosyltransferase [Acidimicrobiia bacterium]|nr:glycosyltransferase [Acidimicrobiia bacterium]
MHVVILAYGPTRVTRSAFRRARALAGSTDRILIVSALDQGSSPIDHHRAELVDGIGTAGLAVALESLGEDPVLVVHDDALVTPRNARRMAESWDRHETPVVPYTNDIGCDPFVGTLPRTDQAADRVDTLASQMSERSAYRVCTTVMYGAASKLHTFTRLKIADPRSTLHDPANPFMVAPAVVAHDGGCRERMTEESDRPILVASMIVKNEEDTLADCLESLSGIVDRIEICDTGSTDRTVEIAESYGANVRHIEWANDFGAARTTALETCRDALFALQIDADERLVCEDPAVLRRQLATYHREYEGLKVRIRNLSGLSDEPTSVFRAIRIFTAQDTVFSGAIHEYPTHQDGRMLETSNIDLIGINHIGYSAAFIAERNKGKRNLEIAKAQYEETRNFRTLFDYARSVRLADPKDPLARELFEATLELIDGGNPQAQSYVYGTISIDRVADGDVDGAIDMARRGLDLVPGDPLCAIGYARAVARIGEYQPIIDLANWRAVTESSDPLYVIDENEMTFLSELTNAFLETGRVDEAFGVAAEIVEGAPRSFGLWPELFKALGELELDHAGILTPLVLMDTTGNWTTAAAGAFPPAVTAGLCLAYLERGGRHPDAVSTGILAAVVIGDTDLARQFDPYVGMLDPETAQKLAHRAAARGSDVVVAMVS